MNGGDRVAEVLRAHGVRQVFTLCGGHISPILVGCRQRGIRVVDTRDEATAVFAADAAARLGGIPGVALVTAGPGVTNAVTAVQNARMAQSPVVLIGGAAPTALQGRGALQDIDQLAVLRPIVKWATSVRRVAALDGAVAAAFHTAREGVPGPVFVECPADLLYGEALVREWYGAAIPGRSVAERATRTYLRWHVRRLFAGSRRAVRADPTAPLPPEASERTLENAAARIRTAAKPLLLIGSQAVLETAAVQALAAAVERLGLPVYLSGMARGLLGRDHPLQRRHRRREALREADLVILAGVPIDFRLEYGTQIRRGATLISVNRSRPDLTRNRRPDVAAHGDPGLWLKRLADLAGGTAGREAWESTLRQRDAARESEIAGASASGPLLDPLHLCREIERVAGPDAVFVADGGDFVGTASYVLRPRGPLGWLDPGAFGTLGVGAGFALAAGVHRPGAEVWLLWGDGAAGYGLSEIDTFVRHGVPVIAVVGNDASWAQIAREQVEILGDDVGTVLARTDYDRVAEGFGAVGLRLDDPRDAPRVLAEAREHAAAGRPVLINAHLRRSEFRKGSISM
jgi:acetolactate synthase-like protein